MNHLQGHVLAVAVAVSTSACVLLKPVNKVFMPEKTPPPRVAAGEVIPVFEALARATDVISLKDEDSDLMVPKGATLIDWYPASGAWEVGRNDAGDIVERFGTAVLRYREGDKCRWTWQNYNEPYMGGGTYGQPAVVVMTRTRDIFTFPCPAVSDGGGSSLVGGARG